MKHSVLKHVAKDAKAHGGRDYLDGRATASLGCGGEAADHVGGARNGVCRSQLYTWLRLARDDRLPGISLSARPATAFVPVRIGSLATTAPANGAPAPPPPDAGSAPSWRRRMSVIEVVLGNGRSLRVEESIDPTVLSRLVEALDGGRS